MSGKPEKIKLTDPKDQSTAEAKDPAEGETRGSYSIYETPCCARLFGKKPKIRKPNSKQSAYAKLGGPAPSTMGE